MWDVGVDVMIYVYSYYEICQKYVKCWYFCVV